MLVETLRAAGLGLLGGALLAGAFILILDPRPTVCIPRALVYSATIPFPYPTGSTP